MLEIFDISSGYAAFKRSVPINTTVNCGRCHVLVAYCPCLISRKVYKDIDLFNLQRASSASHCRNLNLDSVDAWIQRYVVSRLALCCSNRFAVHVRLGRSIDPLAIDHDKQLVLPAG